MDNTYTAEEATALLMDFVNKMNDLADRIEKEKNA
jgi:hypothetical protein